MPDDFYSLELMIKERIGSKYQEAEAERLANMVAGSSPRHRIVRKSSGQALKKVTQVVKDIIQHRKRPSPVPR